MESSELRAREKLESKVLILRYPDCTACKLSFGVHVTRHQKKIRGSQAECPTVTAAVEATLHDLNVVIKLHRSTNRELVKRKSIDQYFYSDRYKILTRRETLELSIRWKKEKRIPTLRKNA